MRTLEGEALESYIRSHMFVDSFLNFLVACQLIHSADHVQKNYLVYASKEGKFTFLPWDMDLTHGRNFECAGGGIWNGEIRYDMWDREFRDQKLLFGTQAHRKCDGWVNVVIDAFLRRASAFRPLYYQRLAEDLAHYYHPEVLIPKVRRLRDGIRREAEDDRARWGSYGGEEDFDRSSAELERWVQKRFDYLKAKLKGLGYEVGPPLNADFEALPTNHAEESPSNHAEESPSNHAEESPSNHPEESPSNHSEESPSNNPEPPSNNPEKSPTNHPEKSPTNHRGPGVNWGPAPLKVQFRNLSAGKFEVSDWDFGDGEKSNEKEPIHIYTKPGRYDVTLRVRGPSGTSTAARKDFVVVSK
jgi:hypothetical protein